MSKISLNEIVAYCDQRTRRAEVSDFPGAENGLQVANSGKVTKVGAAVDAGLIPFKNAAEAGIDLLIVHHGLFWEPIRSFTGKHYQKLRILMDADIAVYASHLPLDCHPDIGNNILLCRDLGLQPSSWFLEYEGNTVGLIAEMGDEQNREWLSATLKDKFPDTCQSMEFGSDTPEKVAILTGSGQSALTELRRHGVDTLITGELKQHSFNFAQEEQLNLYTCGHYATETYGVCKLAREIAEKFDLPFQFLPTNCPL